VPLGYRCANGEVQRAGQRGPVQQLRWMRWQTHRNGVDVAQKWLRSTAPVSPRELTGQRACLSASLAYAHTTR